MHPLRIPWYHGHFPMTGEAPGLAELEQRLHVGRGRRVSVVNAPPDSALQLATVGQPRPEDADVVVAFATRRVDLAWLKSAYTAAHGTRTAWVVYPKPGLPGTDLRWEWLTGALRQYGLLATEETSVNQVWSAVRLCPSGGAHEPSGLGDHLAVAAGDVR